MTYDLLVFVIRQEYTIIKIISEVFALLVSTVLYDYITKKLHKCDTSH